MANGRDYSITEDWQYLPSAPDAQNPKTNEPFSARIANGCAVALGSGVVTTIRSNLAAGFSDGDDHILPTTAIRWNNAKRYEIGHGVAFGIGADGTTVGDDRTQYSKPSWEKSPWKPTIWDRGTTKQISNQNGSAFAIRGETITGSLAGQHASDTARAFIAKRSSDKTSVHYLSNLTIGKWNMITAFSIANNGRILALALKTNGSLEIVVLDSVPRLYEAQNKSKRSDRHQN